MGLLDNLYFGHRSDFGGQNGGLLDFLRNTQMQQDQYQPSGGFAPMAPPQPDTAAQPIQVGGLQMPRIGGADQFDPAQVNIPPNAQPTSGQLPVPAPQQQGGFGGFLDGLNENFQNMGNGGSLIGALTGHRPNNQTAQFLVSKGVDPALAKTIVSDPHLLRAVLPQMITGGGQTDDIKEYNFARQQEPNLTFQQFMARKRAVSGEFGMQPIWGTDKDGKPAVLQLGKSGEAKQSVLPPGFSLARDPIKVEGPTGTTILDPQTRQPVQFIPKDVAGAAAAKTEGAALGESKAALDSIRSKMPGLENVVTTLGDLANKATYTTTGKLIDFGMRQAGMEPREAAVARTQYTAMVDNQVLPLLRDTFGAQFTVEEGKSLRATLGDPDKSPSEKQAVLKAFIEQKRRDVEALESRSGTAPKMSSGGASLPPGWSVRQR